MPPDGSHADFIGYIETLPLVAPPEVFGLHDNANITKDQNDTNNLFRNILLTEKGESGGGKGGASKEDTISAVAADIANKIPLNFDMEAAQIRYPVRWEESMNTVLCQVRACLLRLRLRRASASLIYSVFVVGGGCRS